MALNPSRSTTSFANNALELLANYLNFDFSDWDNDANKELQQTLPPWIVLNQDSKRLQTDLHTLLLPIISAGEVSADVAFNRLSNFVQELNKKRLETEWGIEPGDSAMWDQIADSPQRERHRTDSIMRAANLLPANRRIGTIDTEEEYKQVTSLLRQAIGKNVPIEVRARKGNPEGTEVWGLQAEGENNRLFLQSPRKISLLGYEWFIGKTHREVKFDALAAEREFYWTILDALQSGELAKLRQCGCCETVFVAKRLDRKFCTPQCTRTADRKEAARRVKENRRAKRDKNRRKSWQASDRLGAEALLAALKHFRKHLAARRKLEADAIKKRGAALLLKALEQWKNGDSLNDVYKELPEALKENLRKLADRKKT